MRRRCSISKVIELRPFTGDDLIIIDTYTGTEYDGGEGYAEVAMDADGNMFLEVRFKGGIIPYDDYEKPSNANVYQWGDTLWNAWSSTEDYSPIRDAVNLMNAVEYDRQQNRYVVSLLDLYIYSV